MNKKFFLLIILIFSFTESYSQFALHKQVVPTVLPDSIDKLHYSKKRGWQAAGTVFGLNMAVWGFDRYILDEEFAHINAKTIKNNFTNGFEWDNDQMGTNMFLHPYHGSLYFNAARSNGFNFWESGAFALGGSWMWEMFMENESPSINDIIATPVGGLAFGEVFYRTTDMILDDTRRGRNRVWREFSSFLIAPTRGISRLISGEAWKVRPTTGRQFGIPSISVEVSTGVRVLELQDEILDKGVGMATSISIEYGDKYDNDNIIPYDYFSFRTHLNIHSSQPVLGQINVIGRLWGVDAIDTKKHYLMFGVFQHFDYYDSDTISSVSNKIPYKFGTPASAGIGMYHRNKEFKNWAFESYAHLNAIFIGASLSDHYLVDMRNYNLGNGFGWKLGLNVAYKNMAALSWWYEGYRMFTWKGYPKGYDLSNAMRDGLNAQGDKSAATLNTSSMKLDIKMRNNIYLTTAVSGYRRSTRYKNFKNVYSLSGEGRLMLTYKF